MFYLLDPEKWERQKHFEYYMQMIPCGYTVTVRLDVENLYQQVKKCGLKFYPAFIYCTGKVVNEKREFKMGVDQEGRPGYFDVMHPNLRSFTKMIIHFQTSGLIMMMISEMLSKHYK